MDLRDGLAIGPLLTRSRHSTSKEDDRQPAGGKITSPTHGTQPDEPVDAVGG